MNISEVSVIEFLKPIEEVNNILDRGDIVYVQEMCHSKTVNDRIKGQVDTSANNNYQSPVNITTIYNTVLAMAAKQDDHHEHSMVAMYILVIIAFLIIAAVIGYVFNRWYNKKVKNIELKVQEDLKSQIELNKVLAQK